MKESPYHDIPPGYYSSSGDAAPQLPYYTKAQQNSDEIEPDEAHDDSHLRESLTQFNSSMNGVESVKPNGLVEQDAGETTGQDQDTVMGEYTAEIQHAQQTSYTPPVERAQMDTAAVNNVQHNSSHVQYPERQNVPQVQSTQQYQASHGQPQQHPPMTYASSYRAERNITTFAHQTLSYSQKHLSYATGGCENNGQVNHSLVPQTPNAASQMNTATLAPQPSLYPQQQYQGYGYCYNGQASHLSTHAAKHHSPTWGSANVPAGWNQAPHTQQSTPHGSHGYAQKNTATDIDGWGPRAASAAQVPGANMLSYTPLTPAAPQGGYHPPHPQPLACGMNGVQHNVSNLQPTYNGSVQQAVPIPRQGYTQSSSNPSAAPAPTPAPVQYHAQPRPINQVSQPYIRGQGRFPFKPVPQVVGGHGVSAPSPTATAFPVRTQQIQHQTQQQTPQQTPPQTQPPISADRKNQEDAIERILNKMIEDQRLQKEREQGAERKAQKQSWNDTQDVVGKQLDQLNEMLDSVPDRQQSRKKKVTQKQTVQKQTVQKQTVQKQNQRQQSQIQPVNQQNPPSMSTPFFFGLGKDYQAPTPFAQGNTPSFQTLRSTFQRPMPSTRQPSSLASVPPTEDFEYAPSSRQCRKRSAPSDSTASSEGPPSKVIIRPIVGTRDGSTTSIQQDHNAGEKNLNTEASMPGVNHIDLAKAGYGIVDDPELLHSAGHATSVFPGYARRMAETRQDTLHLPVQVIAQGPANTAPESVAMLEPASVPQSITIGSVTSPALVDPSPLSLNSSPDSFDGLSNSPQDIHEAQEAPHSPASSPEVDNEDSRRPKSTLDSTNDRLIDHPRTKTAEEIDEEFFDLFAPVDPVQNAILASHPDMSADVNFLCSDRTLINLPLPSAQPEPIQPIPMDLGMNGCFAAFEGAAFYQDTVSLTNAAVAGTSFAENPTPPESSSSAEDGASPEVSISPEPSQWKQLRAEDRDELSAKMIVSLIVRLEINNKKALSSLNGQPLRVKLRVKKSPSLLITLKYNNKRRLSRFADAKPPPIVSQKPGPPPPSPSAPAPQSLIISLAQTSDVHTQFMKGRLPSIWNPKFGPDFQSIFNLRFDALKNGVQMQDVEIGAAARNAMDSFHLHHKHELCESFRRTIRHSETRDNALNSPVHLSTLGLPVPFDHAEILAKVSSPDYDMTFPNTSGIGALLSEKEVAKLCTVDEDGNLRARELPTWDEVRASLEFQLKQMELAETSINHDSVVFKGDNLESAMRAIDRRIARAGVDSDLKTVVDEVLAQWLQDWVIRDLKGSDE